MAELLKSDIKFPRSTMPLPFIIVFTSYHRVETHLMKIRMQIELDPRYTQVLRGKKTLIEINTVLIKFR